MQDMPVPLHIHAAFLGKRDPLLLQQRALPSGRAKGRGWGHAAIAVYHPVTGQSAFGRSGPHGIAYYACGATAKRCGNLPIACYSALGDNRHKRIDPFKI